MIQLIAFFSYFAINFALYLLVLHPKIIQWLKFMSDCCHRVRRVSKEFVLCRFVPCVKLLVYDIGEAE